MHERMLRLRLGRIRTSASIEPLRFQPVVSVPVVVAVTAVLLGLLFVRPRHMRLLKRQWATLIGLRLVVVLLMLFAMLRPSFVYTKVEPVRASLVLLVDGSRSMQVADSLGDKSRWDAMKLLLDAAAKDIAKLGTKWDVTAYQFDNETKKLELHDGKCRLAAAPNGEESAIGAAIGDALDREASKRVLATLLLSDGAQRAVAAARPAAASGGPAAGGRKHSALHVHVRQIGRQRAGRPQPRRPRHQRNDLRRDADRSRGRLTAEGYANQRVKVQLLWETADTEWRSSTRCRSTRAAEGGAVPIALHHTPRKPGEYKVTVRVEPREGELVTTNNEASTFVTVRPGGINVLYLVGAKRVGGGPGRSSGSCGRRWPSRPISWSSGG